MKRLLLRLMRRTLTAAGTTGVVLGAENGSDLQMLAGLLIIILEIVARELQEWLERQKEESRGAR